MARREALCEQIAALGLTDKVVLAGFCGDIPAMLSCFDLFVLPSRFEGLGIVLIEAQASGLPCLASTEVPKDTRVLACDYLPLNDQEAWAVAVKRALPASEAERAVPNEAFAHAGYDIVTEAKRLERWYLEQMP